MLLARYKSAGEQLTSRVPAPTTQSIGQKCQVKALGPLSAQLARGLLYDQKCQVKPLGPLSAESAQGLPVRLLWPKVSG